MTRTIGNPVSWAAQQLGHAGHHAADAKEKLGSREDAASLEIRRLTQDDLKAVLKAGIADFKATRSDVMFLCLHYPVMGLVLAGIGLQQNLIPLLFPLVAGFALLGPVAAVGLYEVSRRREKGESASWLQALGVVTHPSFPAILILGLYLLALFFAWLVAAYLVYQVTLGPEPPQGLGSFLALTFTTLEGWAMIVIGCAVGFVFALAVLAISTVSFPLLLDRRVGVAGAVATSLRVFRANPVTLCTWGLIVAAGLVLGSIPALVGLVIVLPVLGHATWHLYRRAVV